MRGAMMGRSVSYPNNCTVVCFRYLEAIYFTDEDGNEVDDQHKQVDEEAMRWEFDGLCDWVKETCKQTWPSLHDEDHWLDREDHVLLANGHCYIGISEYCGLVAIWLVAKDGYPYTDRPELAAAWCKQIAPRFSNLFKEYQKTATFSNGEVVYATVP
jgi:hypothetical protein